MDESDGRAPQPGSLHHVELCAGDLERSVRFWEWFLGALGYEREDDWADGRSWRLGSTYLVVKRAGVERPAFDRKAPGLNHLAFHAASRERVDDLTAAVRDREDASLLYEDQHPRAGGYYALYFENPDRVKVEVVAPE
jgi:catechol 2,3-dioxygenase-like lactoylglutathione lyase family enzyme